MTEVTEQTERHATLAGQRRINIIWEVTQAFLAMMIITGNVVVYIVASIKGPTVIIPQGLQVLGGMVIGFYFSRTNHAAIGGIGRKPDVQEYQGR